MLEPYREGTVNVIAGNNVVTGNNTYWSRQVRPGDKISVDHDVWYVVTTVNSDTEIEIDAAYLGSTEQEKSYIIARDSAQWGMNAAITADVAALMKTYKLGLQAPVDQVAEIQREVTALKDEATEAKEDAQTARQTAVSAAGTATQAKDAAIAAKNDAVTAKTEAEAAKIDAESAKAAAEDAQEGAETAEVNAEAAEAKAQEWAAKMDGPVEGGNYSAKHYANSVHPGAAGGVATLGADGKISVDQRPDDMSYAEPAYPATRTGDTTITISGDVRGEYPAGKRLRFNGSDIYLCRVFGTPVYSGGVTTITVWFDDRTQVIPATVSNFERSRLSPQDTANGAAMSGADDAATIATLLASYCCGSYWS